MYRFDLLERAKSRAGSYPSVRQILLVSPPVWALGFTSLLTDISSEMVNSVLPAYLVLHLHLGLTTYGFIDGIYNGLAAVLVGLGAATIADRGGRQKIVALSGYCVSAVCRLLMLAAGAASGWIAFAIGMDRLGKGVRSAPRDALISLNSKPGMLGTSFGVHRALDAGGALMGPMVAFGLLYVLPGAFDWLWVTSFVVAILGVSVLWLYVPEAPTRIEVRRHTADPSVLEIWRGAPRLRSLVFCGLILAASTISDGFIYLQLIQRGSLLDSYIPLFYVTTALFYMVFAIPAGIAADRLGRPLVVLIGYGVLGVIYCVLFSVSNMSVVTQVSCLILLGMFYASTEGVLVAMVSGEVPEGRRTTGIALLATAIGLGKFASSIAFGWISQTQGWGTAVGVFTVLLALAIVVVLKVLRVTRKARADG